MISTQQVTAEQIQAAKDCDLLALAERLTQLKRVAACEGGEYAGPCPICPGGQDRFRVQPGAHRWLCRHCTDGKWQDAITLQRRATGQGFVEAVQVLADDVALKAPAVPASRGASHEEQYGPPGAAWQARAHEVIEQAAECLWTPVGKRALEWLHARGLADETLCQWHVGYIHEDYFEPRECWGLEDGRAIFLPRGVLIPCEMEGVAWYLKIRRPKGQPKYTQVRGGRPALYMASTLRGPTACVTEGEFDALLLWQSLQRAANPRWRDMGVITLGSQSNRLDLAYWARYLYARRRLLLFYDQDGKSTSGVRYWTDLSQRVEVVRWTNLRSGDKDITDYYRAGGNLLDLVVQAVMQAEAGDRPSD